MSQRVLVLALALSMLFNVFVVIGFVKTAHDRHAQEQPLVDASDVGAPAHAPPSPPTSGGGASGFNRMARDLSLDERQAQVLAALQEEHRQQGMVLDQTIELVRYSLREELRREPPDVQRVRELVSEEADLFRQRRLSEANMYSEFMDELSPAQRRMLRERMDRMMRAREQGPPGPWREVGGREGGPRMPGRPGQPMHERPDLRGNMAGGRRVDGPMGGEEPERMLPRRMLERFDRNGDGRLDVEELRAARRELERRRREMNDRPAAPVPPHGDRGQ